MPDPQFIGGVLIIGFGNSMRGDDALGFLAAQRLEAVWAPREGAALSGGAEPNPGDAPPMIRPVSVHACHQLTPELAEPVSRAGLVIFLDASGALPAGQVACHPVTAAAASPGALGHSLSPSGLLALAHALYGTEPEGILITAGLASTAVGAALSPAAAEALERMVQKALEMVESHHEQMAEPE